MIETTAQASVTSQTIAIEHIKIASGRSFAEVRRKLEATVPKLDLSIAGNFPPFLVSRRKRPNVADELSGTRQSHV
jgi:hypothetical protein